MPVLWDFSHRSSLPKTFTPAKMGWFLTNSSPIRSYWSTRLAHAKYLRRGLDQPLSNTTSRSAARARPLGEARETLCRSCFP